MDFVLTCDLDWASEPCIETLLAIAARFGVRPTVFVTHESAAVRRAADARRAEVGVHPNFLPGSTHGDSIEAVLDHVLALAPGARSIRGHRHHTSPEIERAAASRGLTLDSNGCRLLAPDLRPEPLPSGLLRLPVFFEDDLHWEAGRSWRFADCAPVFFSSGLKVLDVHPFFVALNIPDAAAYARCKPLIPTLTAAQAAGLRHSGAGAGTFLVEALTGILAAGHRFVTLGELADGLDLGRSTPRQAGQARGGRG